MNLAIHQLKKDVRRTRVPLALWLLLVVFQFALLGWTAKPGDMVMETMLPMFSALLAFFGYMLVLVLVPILIHQEPLVGTTAFWFTRPIARATVLASKALFLCILVVLPILVQSIAFLANGVTLHDVFLAAPQLLISELSWILIMAMLAVLTPSFSRFAIVGAIVLVIFYLSLFIVQMVMMLRNPQAYLTTSASLTASRDLVSSLVMIGFGVAVVLVQYLTRRFVLAVGLAIGSALVSTVVQHFWPLDFLRPADRLVEDGTLKPGFRSAAVIGSVSSSDQIAIRGGTPVKQVAAEITFPEVPRGYVAKVDSVDSALKKAGRELPVDKGNNAMDFLGNADPDAVELGLGGVPVLNMTDYGRPEQPLFSMDATAYDRYASTPLYYSAKVGCTVYKYVVAVELPLTKGARLDHGSEHLLVTDVLYNDKGVTLALRHKNVKLLFAPHGRDSSPFDQNREGAVYLLLNRKRHQAVMQQRNDSDTFSPFNGGMLVNEPLQVRFGPDDSRSNTWLAPQLTKDWLADAVLVRLDLAPVVRFTSNVAIPRFRLDGTSRGQSAMMGRSRTADLDELDQIKLPHDATRDQVRDYVSAILVASRRVSEDEHDPQIGMVEKVGTQNVDLLIQMARDDDNYYVNHAINTLAQPADMPMVIDALGQDRDLIDTVIDHGWQADAKAALLEMLAKKSPTSGYYPESWYTALASLKDPSTYDALKTKYIEDPDEDLFKALQALPNFDLAGAVDAAWKSAQATGAWKVREALPAALQFGEPDAIDVAVKMLGAPDNGYDKQRARKFLKQYTPVVGNTDAELLDWFKKNRAKLVFDPNAHKFILAGSPASPPPPQPGP